MRVANRILVGELMDDPGLDPAAHRRALAGLARINRLSGASGPLWRCVRRLHAAAAPSTDALALRLLDIATGSGDVLAGLLRRAAREGVRLDLTACDVSSVALDAAAARLHAAGAQVRTLIADATRGIPLPDRAVDVATCSLFLHHLTEADATRVLAEMGRVASRGVAVIDLQRSPAALVAAFTVPRLLTTSRIVHVDAVRSVRAGWTPGELLSLAARAGLDGATVRRVWPWRLALVWRRPADGSAG